MTVERRAGYVETCEVKSSQNFTVSQVKAFLAASESLSFTKAAAQLKLTQPALSRSIREMEEALGVDLFLRSPHGVVLSPAGEALVLKARQLVEAYECTQAFIAERRAGRSGKLRLAADASIAPVIMSSLLGNMQRELGRAALQIAAMGSEEALTQVLEGGAAMALCGEMEGHSDLRYTPLLEAQLGLIVPPGCVLPSAAQSLDDFDGVPMVRLADCTPVTRVLRRHGVHFPAYFGSAVVFTCLSAGFDLMREQKAAVVATGIGASLLQAQDMQFVPLPGLLPSIVVSLVSPRNLGHDDAMERLRDLVRESVHQSPWHPSVRSLNRLVTDSPVLPRG